jgi:hypothetical protein
VALKINAHRNNISVTGGYLFVRLCALEKGIQHNPGNPQEPLQRTNKWWAELWLVADPKDRDVIFHGPNNGPLAVFRVGFGVQEGRDPLADAYSMVSAGLSNSEGWTIDEVVDNA